MNKHTSNALIAIGLGIAVAAVAGLTGLINDPSQNLVPYGEVAGVTLFLDFLSNFLNQEEKTVITTTSVETPPTALK